MHRQMPLTGPERSCLPSDCPSRTCQQPWGTAVVGLKSRPVDSLVSPTRRPPQEMKCRRTEGRLLVLPAPSLEAACVPSRDATAPLRRRSWLSPPARCLPFPGLHTTEAAPAWPATCTTPALPSRLRKPKGPSGFSQLENRLLFCIWELVDTNERPPGIS